MVVVQMDIERIVDRPEGWPRAARAEYTADLLLSLRKIAGESVEFGFLQYLLGLAELEARSLAVHAYH